MNIEKINLEEISLYSFINNKFLEFKKNNELTENELEIIRKYNKFIDENSTERQLNIKQMEFKYHFGTIDKKTYYQSTFKGIDNLLFESIWMVKFVNLLFLQLKDVNDTHKIIKYLFRMLGVKSKWTE